MPGVWRARTSPLLPTSACSGHVHVCDTILAGACVTLARCRRTAWVSCERDEDHSCSFHWPETGAGGELLCLTAWHVRDSHHLSSDADLALDHTHHRTGLGSDSL